MLKKIPVPVVQLAVLALAFGLQLAWLGYYVDDWLILNAYTTGGAQRLMVYAYLDNRPLVFWIWLVGFKLVGSSAFLWQVWALLWRWLAAVGMWACCRKIWPDHPRETALAAVLFCVYPIFMQQATSITFSFHWVCYALFFFSLYLMALAIQKPRLLWPLLLASLVVDGAQLFSQEFFVGLELLRPVALWLLLPGHESRSRRLTAAIKVWAPYLAVLLGFAVWRLALMPRPGADRNAPAFLYGLVSHPLAFLTQWTTMFLQDVVEALAGAWYKTYQPAAIAFTPPSSLVSWAVAGLAFLILLLYFSRLGRTDPAEAGGNQAWHRTAIPFGFAAVVLGLTPGWAIGAQLAAPGTIYNDKFGLAATFGAAILVVGLVQLLSRNLRFTAFLACALAGLAVGAQFRNATLYRWGWERQLSFYWELKWRVPGLQAPTAVLGNDDLFPYMGGWANASAINQMYAPTLDSDLAGYYYFDAPTYLKYIKPGAQQGLVQAQKDYLKFAAPPQDTLVVQYNPEKARCLWVLSEEDGDNPYLDPNVRAVLPQSDLSRIQGSDSQPLRADTFGAEPAHDWCYYFEKGDLAVQMQAWGEALQLWSEASSRGLSPGSMVEYIPFIQAAAQEQEWDLAANLTQQAYVRDSQVQGDLCAVWGRLLEETAASPARKGALEQVNTRLACALSEPVP